MRIKYVNGLITMVLIALQVSCSSSSSGGGTSTADQITNGIDSAVTKIQSLGTAMGEGTSSFVLLDLHRTQRSSVHAQNAASSCDVNGRPGHDDNSNGVIDSGEQYSSGMDNEYTLQSFYCAMAAETDGPEAVSGAVGTLRMVTCAVEEMLGAIVFDGVARSVDEIRIDLSCASQAEIDDMNGTTGESAAIMPIPATITASLDPTFSEIPNNTHFSHGIKIDGGSQLKFIILAKFATTSGADPLESGSFEFATYGAGEAAGGGTGVEITAGKIERTSDTSGKLWYEFRANRLKTSGGDTICPGTGSNCGWSRHIRFSGDITFADDGDIVDVSGFTGVIANGNDATGVSGGNDNVSVITATGSLTSGITGQIWGTVAPTSPIDLGDGDTLADLTAGTSTCITGGGAISTSCGGAPSALAPTEDIKIFLRPGGTTGDNGSWFQNLTEHGGLGYTGSTTTADEQFAQP